MTVTMTRRATLSLAIALVLTPGAALAQAPASASATAATTAQTDRGFVNVSGGYRPVATSFADSLRVTQNQENGTIDTAYRAKAAPSFDVGAGVRVWRQLAAAIDVAYSSKTSSATLTAQIPHPLFFGRPRTVGGDAPGLARQETAVHAQAVWMMTPKGPWRLDLAGGPSFFTVRQGVVQNVTVSEAYPFDTATLATVVSQRVAKSAVGFNVGADVSYMLSSRVGVGTMVMFSHARAALRAADGHDLSVDAGGAHIGGGLRIRF